MPTATRTDPNGGAGALPRKAVYTPFQLAVAWQLAGGNPAESFVAAAIAMAESGGRMNATHTNSDGSVDYGPWQVNSVHREYDPHLLTTDILYSAHAAVAIHNAAHGFTPWTTYKDNSYKKVKIGAFPVYQFKKDTGVAAAADSVSNAASGAAHAATAIPDFLGKLGSAIFSADWWKRAGFVIAGFLCLVAGIIFLGREFATSQAGSIAKTIINPKG